MVGLLSVVHGGSFTGVLVLGPLALRRRISVRRNPGAALEVVRRLPANGDPDRTGAVGLFGWVGGAVSDIAPDATAYIHRPARMLIEMSPGWRTPPDPTEPFTAVPPDMREWMTELWEVLLPHTTCRSYQNFPDPGLKDWADAYYSDNLVVCSPTPRATRRRVEHGLVPGPGVAGRHPLTVQSKMIQQSGCNGVGCAP